MMTAGPLCPFNAFESFTSRTYRSRRKVEQLVGALDHPLAPVEHFRVKPEYGRDVHGERAVDIDRYLGDLAGAVELVQAVHQFLNPAQGKRRNQQLATMRSHAPNCVPQVPFRLTEGLVIPVGVGRFDDEAVDRTRRRLRVSHDRQAAAADVAREHDALIAALGYPEVHSGGTEDMPCVVELERQVFPKVEDATVGHTHHQVLHRDSIAERVQRLAVRQSLASAPQKLVIFFLDVAGVRQHDGAQVPSGGRGVHRDRGSPPSPGGAAVRYGRYAHG